MKLSRRGILAGAAAGGGLVVAWWLLPRSYHNPLTPGEGEHLFGAWLRVGEDSVVTVAVPQLEMGQGITTLLPQIVAREMGADWRQVAVEPAPPSGAYPNIPLAEKWIALWDPVAAGLSDGSDGWLAERFARENRFSATADGTSLAAYEAMAREAGAAARAMLAQVAAERWGASWETLTVENGIVRGGDRRATFGELAAGAADRSVPDPAPLRPEAPGEDPLTLLADTPPAFARIDLPAKVDGSLQFAGDIRLPGMLHAAIRHGPNSGAKLAAFNGDAGYRVPGVERVIESKRWLAAVAETWWSAERALDAMEPRFTADYPASSQQIATRMGLMLDSGPSFRIAETGFGADGMTRVDLARRYEVEPHMAAPIETASATARFSDGRLELWIASQAPEQAREAAARAIGIAPENVALYPVAAGGSFDARLEHDHAIEVALIAREMARGNAPRPVQLTWSRRSEMIRARPRSPAWMLLGAQLAEGPAGTGGAIDALRVRIACPPAALEFGRRLFGGLTPWAAIRETEGKKDPLACTGAVPPYELPSLVVEHVPVEIGLPVGRVRGNADSYTAFAIESFIDEIARRKGREPLSYRMAMLGSDIRLAACLQRAAQIAGWDGGESGSGQGLACHRIGDGPDAARIACIATARRSAGENAGGVRVTKLSVALDIGRIVNLDIARQQVEGGLIFGLGMALGRAPRWRAGLPASFDYADLELPALADCPEIEIDFIASEAPPADPGEIGAVIAAPAIANALFSATGLRLRRLPLLSDGI